MKSIITLAATLTLAITLTLTACEEKKKQDGADTKPPEAASEAVVATPTQEAVVAEPKAVEVVKGSFTDTRDNKTYKTVKIGEQVWMAENLNYAAKGSKCGGTVFQKEETVGEEEVTYYNLVNENTSNCDKYGRLYDWETAKSACLNGWHLPSNAEWEALTVAVGGEEKAGKYLKATSGWNDDGNGEDKFGFSALPGGAGDSNGFSVVGLNGIWWSSSKEDEYVYAWIMYCHDGVAHSYYGKSLLYSVRCIKD